VPEGAPSEPQVGDLMSALRASVEAARQRKKSGAGAAAPERAAAPKSTRTREHKPASKAGRGRKKAAA
jgi:non-homologous end joining protein Ku